MKAVVHLRGLLVGREIVSSLKEADEMILGWRQRAEEGEDPEEILIDNGIEPDYVMDLLFDVIGK
jgi:hypothetical protein